MVTWYCSNRNESMWFRSLRRNGFEEEGAISRVKGCVRLSQRKTGVSFGWGNTELAGSLDKQFQWHGEVRDQAGVG